MSGAAIVLFGAFIASAGTDKRQDAEIAANRSGVARVEAKVEKIETTLANIRLTLEQNRSVLNAIHEEVKGE